VAKHDLLEILSTKLSRTVEVDPEQLKIEHLIDSYGKTLLAAKPGSEDESVIKDSIGMLEQQLEKYKAESKGAPTVFIGYIPADKITDLDLLEEEAISLPSSIDRRRAMSVLDRVAVRLGVKGHKGIEWDGDKIGFESIENETEGGITTEVAGPILDYYERRRWLRPLRWAIYRMNTLAEKKSKS
jgi:hypothetical protein